MYLATLSDQAPKCVAASTSASVSVNAEISQSTTKDTEGNWVENELIGLSWTASIDALVKIPSKTQNYKLPISQSTLSSYDDDYYKTISFKAPEGATIDITAPSGKLHGFSLYAISEGDVVEESSSDAIEYESLENDTFYVLIEKTEVQAADALYYLTVTVTNDNAYGVADLTDILEEGTPVVVKFSTTTGYCNRDEDDGILTGEAVVQSIAINAPNRQTATYTCQLTGTGPLELADNT